MHQQLNETDVVKLEVETARVADSVAILVPAPQSRRTCVAVNARRTGPSS